MTIREERGDFVYVELDIRNCNATEMILAAESLVQAVAKYIHEPKGGVLN